MLKFEGKNWNVLGGNADILEDVGIFPKRGTEISQGVDVGIFRG